MSFIAPTLHVRWFSALQQPIRTYPSHPFSPISHPPLIRFANVRSWGKGSFLYSLLLSPLFYFPLSCPFLPLFSAFHLAHCARHRCRARSMRLQDSYLSLGYTLSAWHMRQHDLFFSPCSALLSDSRPSANCNLWYNNLNIPSPMFPLCVISVNSASSAGEYSISKVSWFSFSLTVSSGNGDLRKEYPDSLARNSPSIFFAVLSLLFYWLDMDKIWFWPYTGETERWIIHSPGPCPCPCPSRFQTSHVSLPFPSPSLLSPSRLPLLTSFTTRRNPGQAEACIPFPISFYPFIGFFFEPQCNRTIPAPLIA